MFVACSPRIAYSGRAPATHKCFVKTPRFFRRAQFARCLKRPQRARVRCATETTEPGDAVLDGADSLEATVRRELEAQGIELDQLLNPSKVISLERKIRDYRVKLGEVSTTTTTSEKERLERRLSKAQRELEQEKRAIMRQWLKNLFVAQGVLTALLGGWMAFESSLPLYLRALGFWMIWLFTIPSLRARKPSTAEKNALNVSFLLAPLMNLFLPMIVKDPGQLWAAQVIQLLGCYLYYGVWASVPEKSTTSPSASTQANAFRKRPAIRLPSVLRWLDWGSWR
ncbi:hypothetical protein CCYA_CCYA05G1491 [Cyanidiococcus yangmingshanensis]|nr:hypothetical protein CCYA_CCYA05G1491 [Cyanidiococcus yangmingshanensis]